MTTFRYSDLTDIADLPRGGTVLAGGTDLLPLVKSGLLSPEEVHDVKRTDLPSGITRTDDGWMIGALTTLAEVETDPDLGAARGLLGQAVAQAATLQIRHRATVGGTMLQRPRCSYYRNEAVGCWFDGGTECPARDGHNEHHAVIDTGPCVAVQPSDLASALVAVGATVVLQDRRGAQQHVPVSAFLQPPTEDRRSLHTLEEGQVVRGVEVPDDGPVRSTYLKVMDRKAWAFALVGLAAVVAQEDGRIARASLVATGVAATPWRLEEAEQALLGRTLDTATIDEACRAATVGMHPLSENRYKLDMVSGLVRRALTSTDLHGT